MLQSGWDSYARAACRNRRCRLSSKSARVKRVPDPQDGRGKIVCLLPKGIQAIADGNEVKLEIEARYSAELGADRLAALNAALDALAEQR